MGEGGGGGGGGSAIALPVLSYKQAKNDLMFFWNFFTTDSNNHNDINSAKKKYLYHIIFDCINCKWLIHYLNNKGLISIA